MKSLQTRVTAVAALVLLVFVALTSLALERAFQASARSAREERLLGQVYLLMAAADTRGRRPDPAAGTWPRRASACPGPGSMAR